MKAEKWYDVCCDFCGRYLSTDFERGMQVSREAAIKTARVAGFKTTTVNGGIPQNICPICREENKK